MLSSVALLATANAQEATESVESSSSYKQEAGDKTLEFQFQSPFASGSPFSLNAGEIRFRQFKSETFALRAGVHYSYNTKQDAFATVSEVKDGKVNVTESYADVTRNVAINFRPGFELHFDGTERLSPYVGAVAAIGFDKKSVIDREAVDSDFAKTADKAKFDKVIRQKTRTGNLNLGLNAVAGFDYYFTKKLYIGAEMGFGFNVLKPFKTRTTDDNTSDKGVFAGKDGDAVKTGVSTIQFAPNFIGAFRLGYAF